MLVIERIGSGGDEITIRYMSKDVNLKKQYRPFEGKVVLKRGQFEATIEVPIEPNPQWSVEGMMIVTMEVENGAASVGDIDTVRSKSRRLASYFTHPCLQKPQTSSLT